MDKYKHYYMHDPMTVAHEIYLGRRQKKNGHYRSAFVTIWHVDPEKNSLGCRSDDSCGWFSPPYTQEEKDKIIKLAKDQYGQIFAKKIAYEQEKSYAYVCYNQDCYGAIYWSWRAMKALGKKGWQYGKLLSARELDEIYSLSTNPVDNFQTNYNGIKSYEDFENFFILVWRAFRKFHRPWYKHPRWHIHHWRFQFPFWQQFKRKYFERCDNCHKKFKGASVYSDWDGTRKWCEQCEKQFMKPIAK